MATTANQTVTEWLSDILAALGGTAGGGTSTQQAKVQGMVADQASATGINPVIIAGYQSGGTNARVPGLVVPSIDTLGHASNAHLLTFGPIGLLNASNQFERSRAAKADGSAIGTVGILAGAMHGWDGAAYSACKVESSTNPNLRARLYAGLNALASIDGSTDANGNANQGLVVHPFTLAYNGASWDRLRHANIFKSLSLGAATAETTIWTPTTGKKFRLLGLIVTCGTASTLTFKDNTGGTTLFTLRGGVDLPISLSPASSNGILSAAANNVLTVTRGTSTTLEGVLWGTEE